MKYFLQIFFILMAATLLMIPVPGIDSPFKALAQTQLDKDLDALYDTFKKNYKGNAEQKKIAAEAAKEFLRKHGEDCDAGPLLQKWIDKYEENLIKPAVPVQAGSLPIFRTVTVGAGDRTISLGEDVSKIEDLLIKTETGYTLKPNFFGFAKKINLLISKAGLIRAIFFEYAEDKDFEESVAPYTKSLGKPFSQQSFNSQALKIELVVWEDQETRFELVKKVE